MRPLPITAVTIATLVLTACAPVVAGGPPMEVLSGLQETGQLRNIYLSSDWLRAEDDFQDTFTDELGEELRDHVATKIGKISRPKTIIFTDDLPKTRSGKIMRRLLRDVAEGRELGDTTTLADPAVVEEIRSRAASAPAEE